jgi:transposase-like protein
MKGNWAYLYRGVNKDRQTSDFFLSEHRDSAAAKRFLQQAIKKRGIPQKITLDGSAAAQVAVGELQEERLLPAKLLVRTNRYLHNVIEQDHRRVKQRVNPMLGRKRFDSAVTMITGIALVHQIQNGPFDVTARSSSVMRTPQGWEAVPAA